MLDNKTASFYYRYKNGDNSQLAPNVIREAQSGKVPTTFSASAKKTPRNKKDRR